MEAPTCADHAGDAPGYCEANSMTFTGTCATTYEGQTSSTGDDVCWCQ
jgi:hypothetical protein